MIDFDDSDPIIPSFNGMSLLIDYEKELNDQEKREFFIRWNIAISTLKTINQGSGLIRLINFASNKQRLNFESVALQSNNTALDTVTIKFKLNYLAYKDSEKPVRMTCLQWFLPHFSCPKSMFRGNLDDDYLNEDRSNQEINLVEEVAAPFKLLNLRFNLDYFTISNPSLSPWRSERADTQYRMVLCWDVTGILLSTVNKELDGQEYKAPYYFEVKEVKPIPYFKV